MIDIDFKFPNWAEALKSRERELNLFIAAQVQFNRGMLFDQEGAYNGRPRWEDLKFRRGQILSKRGVLRKSIAPFNPKGLPGPDGIVRFAGDTITVGTNLLYARMMNDGTTKMPGGVLRPKNAKALKIPIPQGKSAGEGAEEIQNMATQKKIDKISRKLKYLDRRDVRRTKGRQKQYDVAVKQIAKLAEKMATGKGDVKFIFRKWVKIPARPYDDWNEQDQKDLDAALLNKITQILNEVGGR